MEARTGPTSYLDGYDKILTDAAATGRRPDRTQIDSRRVSGEQAAEAGLSLRSCVAAHLAATRRHWPAGRTSPSDVDRVLSAAEQAIDAFAEGYERAQRLAARQEEADRREFIDDLLHGRSDLGRLAARAERFGLLLSHAYAVAVAEGAEPYDDFHPVTRRVSDSLAGRFGSRNILITTKDGRIICVTPGDQTDVPTYFAKQAYAAIAAGGRIAIGRAKSGGGGVAHSYEEALPGPPGARGPGPHDAGAPGPSPRRGYTPARDPDRLLRRGMRIGGGRPHAVAQRPGADVPPPAHSPAHRLRPGRPHAALHTSDRRHRSPAPGLARTHLNTERGSAAHTAVRRVRR